MAKCAAIANDAAKKDDQTQLTTVNHGDPIDFWNRQVRKLLFVGVNSRVTFSILRMLQRNTKPTCAKWQWTCWQFLAPLQLVRDSSLQQDT